VEGFRLQTSRERKSGRGLATAASHRKGRAAGLYWRIIARELRELAWNLGRRR
jgi:hypothetical protein